MVKNNSDKYTGVSGPGVKTDFGACFGDMPFPAAVFTLDGSMIYYNAAFAAIFSNGSNPPLSSNFSDLISSGAGADLLKRFAALSPSDGGFEVEHSFEFSGKKTIKYKCSYAASFDDDSNISYVKCFCAAARNASEDLLRKKTEELDRYFTSSLDLLCIADTAGFFRRLNPQWKKVLGYAETELLGKPFLEFVHPDDLAPTVDAVSRLSSQNEVLNFINRYRAKDGSYRWLEWNSYPDGDIIYAAARDITERYEMKASLEDTELKYDKLFKNAIFGISLHDVVLNEAGDPVDYIFLQVNPAFEKLTGLKASDIIGKRVTAVLPGIENTTFIKAFGSVAVTGEAVNFEQYTPQLDRYYSIHSFCPKIGQFAAVFVDITDRKKASNALIESEYWLRESQRVSRVGSYVFNIAEGYWTSSEALDEIFGIGPDYQKTFGSWSEIVHSEHRTAMVEYFQNEVLGRKMPFNREYMITRRNDGNDRWVLGRGALFFDEGGRPVKMAGTIQDITERKQAEIALRASEKLYNSLVETAHDLIWRCDSDGRYTYLNKAWEEIMGYGADEMTGRHFSDFMDTDLAAKDMRTFSRLLTEKGFVRSYETAHRRKDGSKVILSFNAKAVAGENGTVIGTQGTARDITELKKAEEELRRSRGELEKMNADLKVAIEISKEMASRAEEANLAKSYFLANMSHELRTPMNGIMGFSALLSRTGLSGIQREFNDMIITSSNHLLELINDILDFSRIEAGKLKLDRKPFDISGVMRNTYDAVTRNAGKKDIEFKIECMAGAGRMFLGDPVRIKQVVTNLLTNALKFTDSGAVRLELKVSERDAVSSDIIIAVEDTGIGIPADKTAEIFEMFHQLDDSHTRKHGGAGIGLSIVKNLVEMMGGTISVKSETGRGSRFEIRIVLENAGSENTFAEKRPGAIASSDIEGKLKILLVEDDDISSRLICAMAGRSNWDIRIAVNGCEALKFFEEEEFDLILMDGQMPEMDGFEATRSIRRLEGGLTKHTPVIAVTAYAMDSDREKFIMAGADDYVAKPIDDGELYQKIKKLVRTL